MAMIAAIHQPNFLPWIGYFYKIMQSDVFVFLDNVQFSKNSFINRNKIKSPHGSMWLTVPVKHESHQMIARIRTNNKMDWRRKHLRTLEMNYTKTRYFAEICDGLTDAYFSSECNDLASFNIRLVEFVLRYLGGDRRIVRASDLDVEGRSTELLVKIVKAVDATAYLSGFGARKYQEEALFAKEGINLKYYDFAHPVYPQLWGEFAPNLSIIDLLFNCGPASKNVLLGHG